MPLFIIDASALKDMFEGKKSGGELLKKLSEMKELGKPLKVITPMASFLRALYLTDPETKIQVIQKALNFLEIGYSTADFKNEKATTDEIVRIASLASKMGKNGVDA
jgi:hypothetical protein